MNAIEKLANEWLDATGQTINDTGFTNVIDLGKNIVLNDLNPNDGGVYQCVIHKDYTANGEPCILEFDPSYEELLELKESGLAENVDSVEDGTVQLVDVMGLEFVVLCDNTVISRYEDNLFGSLFGSEEAFWPYDE